MAVHCAAEAAVVAPAALHGFCLLVQWLLLFTWGGGGETSRLRSEKKHVHLEVTYELLNGIYFQKCCRSCEDTDTWELE